MNETTTTPTPADHPLGRLGAVVRQDGEVLLRFERHYAATVTEVWSAVTDPDRTARWLGRWSGDPDSGHVLLALTDEEGAPQATVTIDRCEPPHRLDVTATTEDGPWPLTVALDEEEGGGTRLVFTHRLVEPYDAGAIGPGWHYYLDRLDAVIVGGPVPDDFADYHPRLADAYPIPAEPKGAPGS